MIEKAGLNDVAALNLLVNSAYRGDESKKGWTTEAYMLDGVRIDDDELVEMMNEQNSSVFKYVENEIILGCVLLKIQENKLYLGMLCVNPNLQNSGIGKKILQFADEFATANKLIAIKMTVISQRVELINWYNRHGYLDSGLREPFPEQHDKDVISGGKLEFIVLEKNLTLR